MDKLNSIDPRDPRIRAWFWAFLAVQLTAGLAAWDLPWREPGSLVPLHLLVYGLAVYQAFAAFRLAAFLSGRPRFLHHPPALLSFWALGILGLPGFFGYLWPDLLVPLVADGNLHLDYLPRGTALIGFGLSWLWATYLIALRWFRPLRVFSDRPLEQLQVPRVVILYGVILAIHLLKIQRGGVALSPDAIRANWGPLFSVLPILNQIEDLKYLVVALATLQFLRGKFSGWMWGGLLSVEVAAVLLSGFKGPILLLGVVVIGAASLSGSQVWWVRPRGLAALAGGFLALLVILTPISEGLRMTATEGGGGGISLGRVGGILQESGSLGWGEGMGRAGELLMQKALARQVEIAHTPGIILMKTPAVVPYQGVEKILLTPLYLVPRVLWENKPYLAQGEWFASTYMNRPEDRITSNSMTIFGDGFILSGWAGALVVAALVGILLAFMSKSVSSPYNLAVYLALLPLVLFVETQFHLFFNSGLQQLCVLAGSWVFTVFKK